MTTEVLSRYEIDIKDVEYLRHGDKPLLARVYKPRGTGPFPLLIDLHGGAWCSKDRMTDAGTDEPLAKSGVVVAALDFRMPPEASYPASVVDINYAIRWFKAHAAEFNARSDRVGILGVSSGGHQAMLTTMRPNESRYSALPLATKTAVDATVNCVVLCWPVIDPLGRYQYAKGIKARGDAKLLGKAEDWLRCHDRFWTGGEAEMAEGSPTLALERGESAPTPPVLYVQGTRDVAHPVPDRDRFIASYRKAGGRVDLHLVEGVGEGFITNDPTAPAALEAIDRIIDFVHRELR